jgi:hypothetical protein
MIPFIEGQYKQPYENKWQRYQDIVTGLHFRYSQIIKANSAITKHPSVKRFVGIGT